jgi:hypothetical protein
MYTTFLPASAFGPVVGPVHSVCTPIRVALASIAAWTAGSIGVGAAACSVGAVVGAAVVASGEAVVVVPAEHALRASAPTVKSPRSRPEAGVTLRIKFLL